MRIGLAERFRKRTLPDADLRAAREVETPRELRQLFAAETQRYRKASPSEPCRHQPRCRGGLVHAADPHHSINPGTSFAAIWFFGTLTRTTLASADHGGRTASLRRGNHARGSVCAFGNRSPIQS